MALDRIVIVGKSGAGKTTLATQLADRLSLTNVELDRISWQANWVNLPKHEMRERVDEALAVAGHWIADGNYIRSVRDIVWVRADTLIWLDYSLRVALLQSSYACIHIYRVINTMHASICIHINMA